MPYGFKYDDHTRKIIINNSRLINIKIYNFAFVILENFGIGNKILYLMQ